MKFENNLEKSQKSLEEQEVQNGQSNNENYKELYIRITADFQNFKRRCEKERGEWVCNAQSILLLTLLPILDDLERAIEASEKMYANEEWLEGYKIIQKNMEKILNDLGVEEVSTIGQFNPEFHEALMQIESTEHKSGNIVSVSTKGYTFRGKLLRAAKVSVAK